MGCGLYNHVTWFINIYSIPIFTSFDWCSIVRDKFFFFFKLTIFPVPCKEFFRKKKWPLTLEPLHCVIYMLIDCFYYYIVPWLSRECMARKPKHWLWSQIGCVCIVLAWFSNCVNLLSYSFLTVFSFLIHSNEILQGLMTLEYVYLWHKESTLNM